MSNNNRLIISQSKYVYLIDCDRILYCKSDNCYTSVYLVDGKCFILVKSLAKVIKDDLNQDNFIRVNQSYLINRDFIQLIDKKNKYIELINNVLIPFTVNVKDLLKLISNRSVDGLDIELKQAI